MKLFKCEVCGYVYESEEKINQCPKCDAPAAKHEEVAEEAANKIINSDETNQIHMELISLAEAMIEISNRGVEIGLDPNCVKVFNRTISRAVEIKGMARAELLGHVAKGKF